MPVVAARHLVSVAPSWGGTGIIVETGKDFRGEDAATHLVR